MGGEPQEARELDGWASRRRSRPISYHITQKNLDRATALQAQLRLANFLSFST